MFLRAYFSDCYVLREMTWTLYERIHFECSFDIICYNWPLLPSTWRIQFYVKSFCETKNLLFSPKHHHNHHHQIAAVFVINVFWWSLNCPSIMDIIGLRVTTRNLRNFPRVTFVHPAITVPPPRVLLQKIQCVVICISSEDLWSHFTIIVSWFDYDRGKVHPITCREDTEGEYRYSSTLSLTSAVDGVGG